MKLRPFLYIAAACALGYGAFAFSVKTANKFVLSEVQSDRPHDPAFDTRPLTSEEQREVNTALQQNYSYFGCGGQAYVFFSDDGKYVIKFFKQRHFRKPTHLDHIPFINRYRALKYYKRNKRINEEYGSYKIGFEQLPRETALMYLHLNKTSHLQMSIVFKDKFGMEHTIDLDKTDFILQKRAELVHDKINRQMAQGDLEGAKKTVTSVVDLIVTRCKKGYTDKDPNISTNCGIFEGRAIKIDVGRFAPSTKMHKPLFFKPELLHITRPFHQALLQKHPQLAEHLDQEILRVIAHE